MSFLGGRGGALGRISNTRLLRGTASGNSAGERVMLDKRSAKKAERCIYQVRCFLWGFRLRGNSRVQVLQVGSGYGVCDQTMTVRCREGPQTRRQR